MRDTLIEAARDAVDEVFQALLGMEPEIGEPLLGQQSPLEAEVTVYVDLEGPRSGALALRCRKDLATHVTGTLLGLEVTEIDDDVKDALGELANIIAGGFARRLETCGVTVNISLPTVVTDRRLSLWSMPGDQTWFCLPFRAENMTFTLDVCMDE